MNKPWEFEDPLCAEVGTEIFFAKEPDDLDGVPVARTYEEARKICQRCDHKIECAEWGIANETYGMWGGLTPTERSQARKKRRIFVTPREQFIR